MVEQALALGLLVAALPLALGPALRALGALRSPASAAAARMRARAARARELGAARLARRAAAALVGLTAPAAALVPQARAVPALESAPLGAAAHPAPPAASLTAAPAPARTTAPAPVVYVVRPGDCLWDIARRHLPHGATDAQIARAWPRWYSANRALIGPDPALIRPGMHLRVPDRRPTGTSSKQHPSSPAPDALATSLDPDRR